MYYILPMLLSIAISGLYFAYNQQWILVQNPYAPTETIQTVCSTVQIKKTVKLFFWHHDAWRQETTTILWSESSVEALSSLITRWLSIMDEEKQMTKKISLQSVALSANNQEVLCSFDRNPFSKQQSTFEKMMWVEGLLKSMRENGIKIQQIRLLIHHQPLTDAHIEFKEPLPLTGFLGL